MADEIATLSKQLAEKTNLGKHSSLSELNSTSNSLATPLSSFWFSSIQIDAN
jgi:hypothetical protein